MPMHMIAESLPTFALVDVLMERQAERQRRGGGAPLGRCAVCRAWAPDCEACGAFVCATCKRSHDAACPARVGAAAVR